jgi:hypothetical protein
MNKETQHKIKVLQQSISRTKSHMERLYSDLERLLNEEVKK